jgi:hypothetical protein
LLRGANLALMIEALLGSGGDGRLHDPVQQNLSGNPFAGGSTVLEGAQNPADNGKTMDQFMQEQAGMSMAAMTWTRATHTLNNSDTEHLVQYLDQQQATLNDWQNQLDTQGYVTAPGLGFGEPDRQLSAEEMAPLMNNLQTLLNEGWTSAIEALLATGFDPTTGEFAAGTTDHEMGTAGRLLDAIAANPAYLQWVEEAMASAEQTATAATETTSAANSLDYSAMRLRLSATSIDNAADRLQMPVTTEEALGGSGTVTRPTLFLAGESGTEDFAFAPRRNGGLRGRGVVVYGPIIGKATISNEMDLQRVGAELAREMEKVIANG